MTCLAFRGLRKDKFLNDWKSNRYLGDCISVRVVRRQTRRGSAMQRLDVAVLGGGVAGLTAAYLLRDRELEVFDSASHVGGRTRSLQQPDGIWLNTGAQYVSTDRVKVVELAAAVGARLIPDDNLEEYWRGLYPPDPDERSEIESVIERITSEQMHRRPATPPDP